MSKISPKKAATTAKAKTSGKNSKRRTGGGSLPKSSRITALLNRPDGATIAELMKITGWQSHSIRGFLSGTPKKRKGLVVSSQKDEAGVMRYRIGAGSQ
jgi:Protein of unknown function (DUF3489)